MACDGLKHIKRASGCVDSMGGLLPHVFVFMKEDLASEPVATGPVYAALTFKEGKGVYRIDCKEDVNNLKGNGQGSNKGFIQEGSFTVEGHSEDMTKLTRTLQNGNIGIIYPDGDKYLIQYDPNVPITFDQGGVVSDSGTTQTDMKTTVFTPQLKRQLYDKMWVTGPLTEAPAV